MCVKGGRIGVGVGVCVDVGVCWGVFVRICGRRLRGECYKAIIIKLLSSYRAIYTYPGRDRTVLQKAPVTAQPRSVRSANKYRPIPTYCMNLFTHLHAVAQPAPSRMCGYCKRVDSKF